MKICAATGNAGKLRELRRILEAQGHEVVSQKELGITIEPDETGTTFAENALIKAETICKASGLPTIADDSGLCVEALNGAPGVYSARYCGRHGDDEANNDKLLEAMKDIPAGQRGAKFVAAVCFILPDGRHLTCVGECPGSVAFARLAGDYGFGYDPLFIPADCGVGKTGRRPNTEGRSYAQLTPDEKDAISHRGNALAEMEQKLPGYSVQPLRHCSRNATSPCRGGSGEKMECSVLPRALLQGELSNEVRRRGCTEKTVSTSRSKEKLTMLTSKQRAILRGKANTMDPVFIVGKGEIDETMIQGVKDCLDARELIKLKVLESSMYNAREASVKLAEATGADCVQVIGSKFVLYLQKKKDSAYADLLK